MQDGAITFCGFHKLLVVVQFKLFFSFSFLH
uniref:Uncharacterized protein n=1 Tax=Rhizophora mucronata TaxID=61149 RepID=A0A2P2NBJ2_RHIMU